VLKTCSAEILHKTEQGLVHLDLQNATAVKQAYLALQQKAAAPVLVCEMVAGKREVMAGMKRFPGFPPAILFGLGGIFTEALEDHVVRLAPFDLSEAYSQIDSIKSRRLLDAYRQMSPVNMEAMATLLVQLGNLALHFPEIIEIDLNPIIITPEGMPVVVDALFVR
jgi:acetyltransferase